MLNIWAFTASCLLYIRSKKLTYIFVDMVKAMSTRIKRASTVTIKTEQDLEKLRTVWLHKF